MKKIITIMVLILFSISLVSAITIYSGDSYELQLDKQYDYYSIVGNSTMVDINVEQDGNNLVTITPNKYSESDSYEIIFFDSEKETITVYQSSGGGGGGSSTKWRTEYIDNNITKYIDKVVEVPGKEIEVEKIVKKVPLWMSILMIISVLIIIYIIIREVW